MENNEFNVDTEQLKSETSTTVKETKDALKSLDVKKEVQETQGFLKDFFKDPVTQVKKASDAPELFGMAIFLNIIWIVALLVPVIANLIRWTYHGRNFIQQLWHVVSSVISPTVGVVIFAVLIMALNKENKKSLTALITTVTIARIPVIIASVIAILTILTNEMFRITTRISGFASVLSIVLLFFATKEIFNEDDDSKFFVVFAKIYALYFIARFILSFLGL